MNTVTFFKTVGRGRSAIAVFPLDAIQGITSTGGTVRVLLTDGTLVALSSGAVMHEIADQYTAAMNPGTPTPQETTP